MSQRQQAADANSLRPKAGRTLRHAPESCRIEEDVPVGRMEKHGISDCASLRILVDDSQPFSALELECPVSGLQRDLSLIVAMPPISDSSLRADLIVHQPGEQCRKDATKAAQIVSCNLRQ